MPDETLFRLAGEGKLRSPEVLAGEVRRMLADPKARALVDNFAGQWLQIRNLKAFSPDRERYPDFDEPLRQAMFRETELFFAEIIREDRSILDLLDADFTYLNERLARHYGIRGVTGDEFRRVRLTSPERGGLLTQASILTVTSNPNRTSPVKRGRWVLEQVLGTPPPPPPPDVSPLKNDHAQETTTSMRRRMEQHRARRAAPSATTGWTPWVSGWRTTTALGAWRDKDGGRPSTPRGRSPRANRSAGRASSRRSSSRGRASSHAVLPRRC